MPDLTLISAVPVPFRSDGSLDRDGLHPLFAWLQRAGVDGVFAAGTTGEFIALDDAERLAVIAAALDVFGADRTYAHIGAATARQAQSLATRAVDLGARHLAAVTPYFLPTDTGGLLAYYRSIAAAADGAMVYPYVFPARTTNAVSPRAIRAIADEIGIAGVKVSGEPDSMVRAYVTALSDGSSVYTGNDATFHDLAHQGVAGVVSGVSSVMPEPFVALIEALRAGDDGAARTAQRNVLTAVSATGAGDIALLKQGLVMRGLPAGAPRAAVPEPAAPAVAQLRRAISELTSTPTPDRHPAAVQTPMPEEGAP